MSALDKRVAAELQSEVRDLKVLEDGKAEIERLQAQAVTYTIWGPDQLPIHQEELRDLQDVIEVAASFPTRYIKPGYYLDAHHNRIPPEELYQHLRLEVAPAETMSLTQAYVKYIQDNLERIGADWQPVCFDEFKESEECENYLNDEPPIIPSVGAEWHKIGEAAVDSGCLLITDPCYLSSEWKGAGTDAELAPLFRHKDGRALYCTLHGDAPEAGAVGFGKFSEPMIEFGGKTPNEMREAGDMEEVEKEPSGEFSSAGCFQVRTGEALGGQLKFSRGHAGAGVAFAPGVGDGCYDVYARYANLRDWGKRVAEIRIVMIEPNAEDEVEEFMDAVAANSEANLEAAKALIDLAKEGGEA